MNATRIQNLENGIKELRQQNSDLQSKVAQLTQERDESRLEAKYWNRGFNETEAQAQKYKEALEKYGKHTASCPSNRLRTNSSSLSVALFMDCNCGLDQALQGEGKEDICHVCNGNNKDMVLTPREPTEERIAAINWQLGPNCEGKTAGTTRAIYKAAITDDKENGEG